MYIRQAKSCTEDLRPTLGYIKNMYPELMYPDLRYGHCTVERSMPRDQQGAGAHFGAKRNRDLQGSGLGPSTSGGRDLQGLNGTRTADFTVINARNAWQSRSNRVCQISCVAMFSWGADLQRFFNQDL